MPRMLDLFAGRMGWSKAFLARGWDVVAIDLVEPPDIPTGVEFVQGDIMQFGWLPGEGLVHCGPHGIIPLGFFDFICASSPCEGFSCFTMKMFQPNPKHPEIGIKLFDHARSLCVTSRLPYVMENVRGAIQFVGKPDGRCGPFCLWGNAVPPILPQGITKSKWFTRPGKPGNICAEALKGKRQRKAVLATIPPELSFCIADYAEALMYQSSTS